MNCCLLQWFTALVLLDLPASIGFSSYLQLEVPYTVFETESIYNLKFFLIALAFPKMPEITANAYAVEEFLQLSYFP